MTTSFMALHGARLVDNGFHVLPILPGQKAPGQFLRGEWRGYRDWSKHCDRPTKSFELKIWSQWPDAGIGVACGNVTALDIDVMDSEAVARIEALAYRTLGETPAVRIGQLPKRLLVYRAEKPFAGIKQHPLEFLGRGNQFVAYGMHPGTGQPYQWPFENLADLSLATLPAISEQQARAFLEEAAALVPEDLRQARLTSAPRSLELVYSVGQDDKVGTREAVEAALGWIPNADLHYDDWIRIGMAIKTAIGEDGRDLWESWSASSAKNDPAYTARKWERDIKRDTSARAVGAGTIYRYAMDNGWAPEPGMILNGQAAERAKEPHPAAALIQTTNVVHLRRPEPEPEPEPEALPLVPIEPASMDFVHEAPGLLGEMVRWMNRTAISPQPFLSLGAALCAIGVAAGNNYRFLAPDTYSNIYVIAVAGSGAGKDHPRKCVRRLYREAGLDQHIGGETLKSGSALLGAVAEQPRILFQIDEFGHFIRAVLDRKRAGHHIQEIMANLTTLWSSGGEWVRGPEYADRKLRPRRDIKDPCCCLYGSTVPAELWAALQSGSVQDGSLARFLLFRSEDDYPDEQTPAPMHDGLEPIALELARIAAGPPQQGNMAGIAGALTAYVVPFDDGALEADSRLREEQLAMKRRHRDTEFSAIIARFYEHVRRIALIAAVASDSQRPVCTAAHLAWAETLVRHCQATLLDSIEQHVSDSEYDALCKRILNALRKGPVTRKDMNRIVLRSIDPKERVKALADLMQDGLIAQTVRQAAGRPTTFYSLASGELDG